MLQPHPTVSVIVINYNGRQHLTTCFESLLALDYPPDALELILADNASADDSVALVRRRFPSVRIIAHPQNYGFAGGNNRAAEQAGGRYIVFLNNDMRVQPDWLKSL
ncbi:MAG: glycosyltransferase family 2 protein, partial [Anaerolineae bacterium]